MSSIRELCNQLGFGPGGQFGVLTQSFLKRPAHIEHGKFDPTGMLEEARQFIKQYVTPSGQRAVDLSTSQTSLSPEFGRISMSLLTTCGLGPKYWPQSTALKPINGFQWPRDKHRICDHLSQILVYQVKNMKHQNNGKVDLIDLNSDSSDSPLSSLSDVDSEPRLNGNIVDLEDMEIESDGDTINIRPLEEELPSYEASRTIPLRPLVFATDEDLIAEIQEWRRARNNIAPPGAESFSVAKPTESDLDEIQVGNDEADATSSTFSSEYMGWILKRSDTERLLVKVCSGSSLHDDFRCQGWLGGDLGFAPDPLVTARGLGGSLKPFFYPRPYPTSTKLRSPDNQRLLSEIEDTEERSHHNTARSSYNLRKKSRKKISDHQPKLKPGWSSKPSYRKSFPQSKKRGGLNWQGLLTPSSLTPKQSAEAREIAPARTIDKNLVDNLSNSVTPTQKRLRSPTPESIILNSKPSLTLGARIKFHFFLSDSKLGAIARAASMCNSANAFFDAARAAWKVAASDKRQESDIVGVTVSWEGAKRSIFILWGDDESFQNMMVTVSEAERIGSREVDVEVRCIVQE
ncbi:hypothetical protein MMC18_006351 [Xylographa bjoerkii]|nr:hypothetical protein [Xylographa bjoerkii]